MAPHSGLVDRSHIFDERFESGLLHKRNHYSASQTCSYSNTSEDLNTNPGLSLERSTVATSLKLYPGSSLDASEFEPFCMENGTV
jgi:hypothetical protein